MHIVYDDIIYSLQKSGGGSVYWTEHIKRINDDVEHYIYDNAKSNIFMSERNINNSHLLSSKYLQIKRFINFKLSKMKNKFIFHSSMYRYCKNKNAINITSVHDFTYEYFRNDLKALFHKIQKKNSVKHSKGIICISENTKKDLLKFYPNINGRIKVIYNGYDTKDYYFKNYEHRNNDILFVGARSTYKRFDLAVKIVSLFPQSTMKIIGGGELSKSEKQILDNCIPGKYQKLGYVSNNELCELYNKAFFLCYPSEYEGFGIPIIEAQACGCPVVCQKKSSVPEVAGNAGIYFDSLMTNLDIFEIQKINNKEIYNEIQQKGLENCKKFSWDITAKEVYAFYEELYKSEGN